MKKFRGKRRYFRNLQKEAHIKNYDLDFSAESWFDFWHTHIDFCGHGNDAVNIRKQHLKALFNLFNEANKELEKCGKPYQLWIELCHEDASMDALFIHSPNPNADNFPHQHSLNPVNVKTELPAYLTDIINVEEYKIASYEMIEEEGSVEKLFVIQLQK